MDWQSDCVLPLQGVTQTMRTPKCYERLTSGMLELAKDR
jgi:hypothetical protein